MRLVYKYRYNGPEKENLLQLCEVSKNLYNQALYIVRQELIFNNRFVWYSELDRLMKEQLNLENEINYRLMPKAQCAQQCLKVIDRDLKSYIKAVKDWSKNPGKYTGKPNLPKYKKKHNQLIYPNQSCSIKDGYIQLTKTLKIEIPQWEKYKDKLASFQQIRINPRLNGQEIDIEIIYLDEEIENSSLDKSQYASIDLGINNFVTMVDSSTGDAVIYNGKQLKTINQWYNKRKAEMQSNLSKCNGKKKTSLGIKKLTAKRNNKIDDLLHKTSRNIVRTLIKKGIGTLIVGHNKGWKDSINIGTVNNQNFVGIPFSRFISFLKYKCAMAGINFIETEESHTSKCDALALEEIGHQEKYLGKRIKRGLFQSSIGKLINADVNGALNILRKVVGDSPIKGIVDRGRLFRPAILRDLYSLGYCF